MVNLTDITGTVCQTPIFPTVLTMVLLTAAVKVEVTMKWNALSVLKCALCGHMIAHTLGHMASHGDSRCG